MSNQEAIALLRNLEDSLDAYCELNEEGKTAFRMAIKALNCSEFPNNSDTISRQAAISAITDELDKIDHVPQWVFDRLENRIERLPSVQSEKRTEKRTETHACELIDRQAAIDAVLRAEALVRAYGYRYAADAVRELSAVQPARLKGRWIERNPQNSDKCRLIECDQCGFSHIVGFNVPYEHWIEDRNFCERCGADMRGEQDG